MKSTEMESVAAEVIPATTVRELIAAEVDVAIATAHRFPRDPARALDQARTMASASAGIAESCRYVLRRGGSLIEGPSVRLAEIMATSWGNLRVGTRLLEVGQERVVVQGVAHDLERNLSVSVEVSRRLVDKTGRRYATDVVETTIAAAHAIARRNAVLITVPRAFVDEVYERAKAVAVGQASSSTDRRDKILLRLAQTFGVTEARACAAVGAVSRLALTAEQVSDLVALGRAVKEGEQTLEEAFPEPDDEKAAGKSPAGDGDALLAQWRKEAQEL